MRRSPEFDLIAAIRERLPPLAGGAAIGIGDDAAVTVPEGATATSVDAIVEGVHFRRPAFPLDAVGHKAIATALSDLAAMGAAPGEAYVWLGRPETLDDAGCLEICDGLAACAAEHGVAVLGGDLTASPVLALSVTAVGHAPDARSLVGRSGAAVGEAVCLTGAIGGAAAGLLLLDRPEIADSVPAGARAEALQRQLRPQPQLAVGRALAASGARAMIDLSDGLGADAEQIAAASGVGIRIEMERVPLAAAVEPVAGASGREPHELALGGEDYELLCVLRSGDLPKARDAVRAVGGQLIEVGRTVAGRGVGLRLPGGGALQGGGYDHLRR
jgi:thiamine-monophosphate kinase